MTNNAKEWIRSIIVSAHNLESAYNRYIEKESCAKSEFPTHPTAEEKPDFAVEQFWNRIWNGVLDAYVVVDRELLALEELIKKAEDSMPFSDEDIGMIAKGA